MLTLTFGSRQMFFLICSCAFCRIYIGENQHALYFVLEFVYILGKIGCQNWPFKGRWQILAAGKRQVID